MTLNGNEVKLMIMIEVRNSLIKEVVYAIHVIILRENFQKLFIIILLGR